MKKETTNTLYQFLPAVNLLVSCRDKNGRNNALAVGMIVNVSTEPAMVMIGISPEHFSHHIIKESGEFILNFPIKEYEKEYYYLGSKSGKDEDKFKALDIQWESGTKTDAPCCLLAL